MTIVQRFAIMLSVFIFVAPVQFLFLFIQLAVLSSLANWFLVLLPAFLGLAIILLYGVTQACRKDRRNVINAFDVLFFFVSDVTLLLFFLLLAQRLNGDSAVDNWLVVFVPLMIFAFSMIGFQLIERMSCQALPLHLVFTTLVRCHLPNDKVLQKYRDKSPRVHSACHALLLFFWGFLWTLTILLPLALEQLIPWSIVFVFMYITLFIIFIEIIVHCALVNGIPVASSVNNIAKIVGLTALLATVIAFHVYTVAGEDKFPVAYILASLIIASATASFAILYIRWDRARRAKDHLHNSKVSAV